MTLFFCQPLRMNGPDPAEFWFSHSSALSVVSAASSAVPPFCVTRLLSMMPEFGPHRTANQSPNDSDKMVLTVVLSHTRTSFRGGLIQTGFTLMVLKALQPD